MAAAGAGAEMKPHLDRLILWFFYAAIVVVLIAGLWGWTSKIQWERTQWNPQSQP
jgi:hypothetical protein